MKKITLLLLLTFLSMPVFAYKTNQESPQAQKATQEAVDRVEIIEGVPSKKFKKIQPVWATDLKMPNAMKKLKKDAAKLGADAIIEFQFSTQQVSSAGASSAIFLSSNQSQPVVQGWAVKWIE